MKKSLLFVCAVAITLSASAQNRKASVLPGIANFGSQNYVEPSTTNNSTIINSTVKNNPSVGINAITDIPLGYAGNGFGGFTRPGRAILNYNPSLHTLTLSHRSCSGNPGNDGSANNGYFFVDISKDGGNTWTAGVGPVYDGGGLQGRYPQGFIINPTGNTIADNAFITMNGAMLGGASGPWNGYARGTAPIGSASVTTCEQSALFNTDVPYRGLIPDAGCISNDIIWISDLNTTDGSATTVYNDSILLHKGVLNTSTNCVDYTSTKIYFPVYSDATNGKYIVESNIVFDATGQTGYIAVIATGDTLFAPNYEYYVTTWKTTDGGSTWSAPNKISMDVNTQMMTTGITYASGFQLDGAVDKNGKLHLIMPIMDWNGAFVTNYGPLFGSWGMFSVVTDGTINTISLLDKPHTYRGYWPSVSMSASSISDDNRGQIAISQAGDQVFYVWFATDTTVQGDTSNVFPDAYLKEYDVTNAGWGPVKNLTSSAPVAGTITFGYVANIAGGTNPYTIHIGYQTILDATNQDPVTPVQFHYLKGVVVTGVDELENNVFSISDAFPNPSVSTSTIEVNMKQTGKISLEVSNVIGQVVYSSNANLSTGFHKFTLDASKWNSGVYFYTLKSKEFTVTKKLVRE